MKKRAYFTVLIIFTVLFVLPPLAYIVGNFYTYLFDGWALNEKFIDALFWLLIVSMGYFPLGIVYSYSKDRW